jgi:hypothetical protein
MYAFLRLGLIWLPLFCYSQASLTALRAHEKILVDGKALEDSWLQADSIHSPFVAIRPFPGVKSKKKTQVKVLYDDFAIYLFARCEDPVDSISNVYTVRDDYNTNADIFSVFIDTYNDRQNGFYFGITSMGVQLDGKIVSGDVNDQLNLVWESSIHLTPEAWQVELKIPYSALRFPKQHKQMWNVNFSRQIARFREESSWVPVNPDFENYLVSSGSLEGISSINPPIRLSLIPYVSSYLNEMSSGKYSRSFFGGMDVKYGINEAFTLDVTLVPDFGQVIFDNQVLNTSPFEIQFNENRQFFTEGMELFNKSGIFYSRRIGVQAPWGVLKTNLLDHEIISGIQGNPQLYNASKFSGRNKKGLGVGVFNAVSAPTYGTAFNTLTNTVRDFLAAPLTNYNTLVLDQNIKNNSSLTFTNTNVLRQGNFYDANVSALNSNINFADNTYFINGKATLSQKFDENLPELGYNVGISAGKQRGNITYAFNYFEEDDRFDPNDLGFNALNNRRFATLSFGVRRFKPWWKFVKMNTNATLSYNRLYAPNVYTESNVDWSAFAVTKQFNAFGLAAYSAFTDKYDYFEPRTWGAYYRVPRWYGGGGWLSTNYQKKWAIDANFYYVGFASNQDWKMVSYMLAPRIRISNKMLLMLNGSVEHQRMERGFAVPFGTPADTLSGILFGERDRMNFTQFIEWNYTLTNRMNLSLRARHYWSMLSYHQFFTLNPDGTLAPNATLGLDANGISAFNLNYNALTIDAAFRWVFKQGSEVSFVWKSSVFSSEKQIDPSYFQNMQSLFESGLLNSFSIKLLYWLDVAELKKVLPHHNKP